MCQIVVSLIRAESIAAPGGGGRDYSGELSILSVGRLDAEKNPELMIDVLSRLEEMDPGRWQLKICGEGGAIAELQSRLNEDGLADRCKLLGYVSWGSDLDDLYRSSRVPLHVSRTEGFRRCSSKPSPQDCPSWPRPWGHFGGRRAGSPADPSG